MTEVKRISTRWRCCCGKRVEIPPDHRAEQALECPYCGKNLKLTENETADCDMSSTETQRVGFYDMAQLAQEDVDVSDSDEWDTSEEDDDTTVRI